MSDVETKIKELIEIAKAAQTEFESAVKFRGAVFAATNYNGMLIILDDKTQKHLKTFSPAFVLKLLESWNNMHATLKDISIRSPMILASYPPLDFARYRAEEELTKAEKVFE